MVSATAVVNVGNREILGQGGSYVEKKLTKERIKLLEVSGAFVLETEPGQGAICGFDEAEVIFENRRDEANMGTPRKTSGGYVWEG